MLKTVLVLAVQRLSVLGNKETLDKKEQFLKTFKNGKIR